MIYKYLEIIFNIHKIGEDELIMKRVNRNTGITLIALVITIIVLLILADPHIFLNIPQ